MKTKEEIKEFYDNAYKDNYEGTVFNPNMQHSLPFWLGFMEYIRPFTKEHKVLEIGCGDGRIIHCLADKAGEITGIDISKVAIEKAKDILKKKLNTKLYVADNIRFLPDNYFDLIFEITTFQHMLKVHIMEYVAQCYQKVKDDGYCLFQVIDGVCDNEIEGSLKDKTQNFSNWTQEEFRTMLEHYKFKIVSFNIHDIGFLVNYKRNYYSYYVIAQKNEK